MVGVSEAYIVAAVAFLAMVLYGIRSGSVRAHIPWDEKLARYSLIALLGSISVAFLDVANSQQAGLLWRQWLVFVCVIGVAVGYGCILWRTSHYREKVKHRGPNGKRDMAGRT